MHGDGRPMNSKRTFVRHVSGTRGLPESVIDYDPSTTYTGMDANRPPARHTRAWMPTDPQTPSTTYTGMDANRPPARHTRAWMPTDPRHDIHGHGCQQTPARHTRAWMPTDPSTTYTGMDANRPPDPQHDRHGHGGQQTSQISPAQRRIVRRV